MHAQGSTGAVLSTYLGHVIRYTGATVHFVDEKYDTGPILAQRVVPVRVDDTPAELASRVLKEVCAEFFQCVYFLQ
jgi:folate-dependent phosphoribosylglycinamide formyltransferase PurN